MRPRRGPRPRKVRYYFLYTLLLVTALAPAGPAGDPGRAVAEARSAPAALGESFYVDGKTTAGGERDRSSDQIVAQAPPPPIVVRHYSVRGYPYAHGHHSAWGYPYADDALGRRLSHGHADDARGRPISTGFPALQRQGLCRGVVGSGA